MWRPTGDLGAWRRRNHVQPEDDETIKQNLNVKMQFLCICQPESLKLLVSYLKGEDTEVTHSLKMELMLDCTGISLKTGDTDFRISSVNKLLCGELLNIKLLHQ